MAEWVDLEHKLWQQLKSNGLDQKKILVGFSGGVDSMALLWALRQVKKQDVTACFIHHGTTRAPSVTEYRNRAEECCREFCRQHDIPFESRRYEGSLELHSENDLRDFRHQALQSVLKAGDFKVLALAHHQDDLLETRLIRLIRGTGAQGLRSMQTFTGSILRPFLRISKAQLSEYLQLFKLAAFSDPSNETSEPFRNWVRNEWLPMLEARQAGATQSLARSLEILTEAVSSSVVCQEALVLNPSASQQADGKLDAVVLTENGLRNGNHGLSRVALLALSKTEQKQALARFVSSENKRDFSHAHIEEVLKRLQNPQNEMEFRVGGIDWCVNAQQIQIKNN